MNQTTDDPNAFGIVNDVNWFPVELDLRSETIKFVRTDADEVSAQPFVSLATWKPKGARRRLSIAKTLATWSGSGAPRTNFIWHTGFCASTLISRVLDRAGHGVSLREPDVLSVLADVKRARMLANPKFKGLPRAMFGLLSRPLASGATLSIKPAPAANILAPEAAEVTSGKMLFLYSDLKSFLIAVARGGETRRGVIRTMFSTVAADGHLPAGLSAAQLMAMPDLQIAALVWHMHMAQMRRSMDALGERTASLDCDVFLKDPESAIARLDAFFGIDPSNDYPGNGGTGSEVLQRHAKTGQPIADPWAHRMEEHDVDAAFGRDVDKLTKWSYQMCKTPAGIPLPRPLEKIAVASQ